MNLVTLYALFLGLVFVMAAAVLRVLWSALPRKSWLVAAGLLTLWLVYVGSLGYAGVIARTEPPGLVFLVVPITLFQGLFLTRHPQVATVAGRVPLTVLIGLQVFRVPVEGELYGLYKLGLLPQMLTFEGANLDILTGLSAPIVAWLYDTGKLSLRALRVWNALGIALLVNVVARAALTLPGSLYVLPTEVPNRALGTPPFMFLPGFLVPLALSLHVLALRAAPAPTESKPK